MYTLIYMAYLDTAFPWPELALAFRSPALCALDAKPEELMSPPDLALRVDHNISLLNIPDKLLFEWRIPEMIESEMHQIESLQTECWCWKYRIEAWLR